MRKMLRRWVWTVFWLRNSSRGDLGIGHAVDDEPCDLQFAFGQRLDAGCAGLARPCAPVDAVAELSQLSFGRVAVAAALRIPRSRGPRVAARSRRGHARRFGRVRRPPACGTGLPRPAPRPRQRPRRTRVPARLHGRGRRYGARRPPPRDRPRQQPSAAARPRPRHARRQLNASPQRDGRARASSASALPGIAPSGFRR